MDSVHGSSQSWHLSEHFVDVEISGLLRSVACRLALFGEGVLVLSLREVCHEGNEHRHWAQIIVAGLISHYLHRSLQSPIKPPIGTHSRSKSLELALGRQPAVHKKERHLYHIGFLHQLADRYTRPRSSPPLALTL